MSLKDKIINGEILVAKEVKDIVFEYTDELEYKIVDEISNGHGRWTEYMTTVFELCDNGKFYALDWDRGLTEYQENNFYAQFAKPVEKKEVITYEWTTII